MIQKPDFVLNEVYDLFKQGEINLNLGCGDLTLEHCINCDLFDERADKKLDAKDLSEFPEGTVNAIYAGQLLEHFDYQEVQDVLAEWRRALRKGGYLIVHLPDMEALINLASDWINGRSDKVKVIQTKSWEVIPDSEELWVTIWTSLMASIYGNQCGPGQYHKWGYCAKYLAKGLTELGFKVRKIYKGYPKRLTPSMMIIAQKEDKKDG